MGAWTRRRADLATDLAQAILVSHLDMIIAVLDDLGVPHEDGFFAKDTDVTAYLNEGWQQRAWEQFHGRSAAAAAVLHQPPGLGGDQSRTGVRARRMMLPLYGAFEPVTATAPTR